MNKEILLALAVISEHIINVQKSELFDNQYFVQLNTKYTKEISEQLHYKFDELTSFKNLSIEEGLSPKEYTGMSDTLLLNTVETICIEITDSMLSYNEI